MSIGISKKIFWLHSLVSLFKIIADKTIHTTYTRMNHPNFLPILLLWMTFYSYGFFTRTTILYKWLSRKCFPEPYNHKIFNLESTFNSPTNPHKPLFLPPLSWLSLNNFTAWRIVEYINFDIFNSIKNIHLWIVIKIWNNPKNKAAYLYTFFHFFF